jgi:plastocyanin
MVRLAPATRRLRPLALAVVLAAALAAPAAISAQAAEDNPAAAPAPAADAAGSAPPPAPAVQPPTAAPPDSGAAPRPAAGSAAVTVSRAHASASHSVSIVDFAFDPGPITVQAGDSVQWANLGQATEGHDVTGDGLDSGLMLPGAIYSHTFKTAGTFFYSCTIHPDMTGSVRVLAAKSPSKGSGGSGSRSPGSGNSGSGSGSGSSGSGSVPRASGGGSESAAVSAPDAAGSSSSLPSTGSDSARLAALGCALLALGLGGARAARRRG